LTRLALMMIRLATDGDRDAIFVVGVAEEAAWFGRAEISAEEVSECLEMPSSVRSSSSVRTMARSRTSSLHHATGSRRALCPNDFNVRVTPVRRSGLPR
jgi:Mg-chelatase subunit ChlI